MKLKEIFKYRVVKVENMSLTKQLVCVTLVALLVSLVMLGIILPSILKPFYENNVYSHLSQPASYIRPETNKMGEDIAFIIITKGGAVYTSSNLSEIVPGVEYDEILNYAKDQKGKFRIGKNVYYYYWGSYEGAKNLIITDTRQIISEENNLLEIILPTLIATISITVMLLFTWSQYILSKIKKLDKRTKAIITGEKVEGKEFIIDDELSELNNTIEKVDLELKEKEEYKNMMFQNLSHELKTPISVIQSYIEGIQDGVVEEKEAVKIISEETKNLYSQVNTILQINKIDYMKDSKKYLNSKVKLDDIISETVEKHKLIRPDIKYIVTYENSKEFVGTYDMWKAVFDNILGNFIRYAKHEIKISINENKVTLENDGEKLDENMLEKIFLPYVKGKGGQSGLGLSIVKKTVNIFGYDIKAKNTQSGIMFEIK